MCHDCEGKTAFNHPDTPKPCSLLLLSLDSIPPFLPDRICMSSLHHTLDSNKTDTHICYKNRTGQATSVCWLSATEVGRWGILSSCSNTVQQYPLSKNWHQVSIIWDRAYSYLSSGDIFSWLLNISATGTVISEMGTAWQLVKLALSPTTVYHHWAYQS